MDQSCAVSGLGWGMSECPGGVSLSRSGSELCYLRNGMGAYLNDREAAAF